MTCHASSATFPPEEGLILESGVSRENLVGKPSKQNPTLQLVEPDNPGESYLLQTLQGQTDILGEQMLLGGHYLSPSQINRGVKRTFLSRRTVVLTFDLYRLDLRGEIVV